MSRIAALLALSLPGCGPTTAAGTARPDAARVEVAVDPVSRPRSFEVKVVGKGPPLVLVPGLGCSGRVWQSTVERYQDRYELHVITLRGFGGTEASAPSGHLLDDVRQELVAHVRRLDHPVLIGHSLGAFLSYWVAATEPDRVGGVVAVDGVPFLADYFAPGATVASTRPRAEAMRAHMKSLDRGAFADQTRAYLASQITRAPQAAEVAEDSVRSNPQVVAEAMYELMTTDLRETVATITAPTLHLVAGGLLEDTAGKERLVAHTEAQLARVAHHTIVLVPQARHFVMLDDPDLFFASLDSFLLATKPGASRGEGH